MRTMPEVPRPRLLFVVNVGWFFLSHRLPLALAAARAGYDVHVAADFDDAAEAETIRSHGLVFHRIRLRRSGTTLRGEWRTLQDIARLYRRLRPDLVHHVTIKPVIYGSLAARWTRTPGVINALSGLGYVFTARGALARWRSRATLLVYRWLLNRARSLTIVQNSDDYGDLVGKHVLAAEHTLLIRGSGVDLEQIAVRPVLPEPPLVVLPARMLWDKGIREFCEAAGRLRASGVRARFALVGGVDTGNPAGATQAEIEDLAALHGVEWWGFRKDMAEVFALSHVVCLPSYREGLPKVLIEAAAAGRPVVTCDVPGCREAIRVGETGLAVPARDAAALAAALERLLLDAELRARMGAAARRMAESDFSIESVVARTLEAYRSLTPVARAA